MWEKFIRDRKVHRIPETDGAAAVQLFGGSLRRGGAWLAAQQFVKLGERLAAQPKEHFHNENI